MIYPFLCRSTALSLSVIFLLTPACSPSIGEQPKKPDMVDESQITPVDDPFSTGHLTSNLSHQQEEDLALTINLSGRLCAKIVGARNVGQMILVECQKYRKKQNNYIRYWIRGLGEGQSMSVSNAFILKKDGWQKVK